jgi:hypothetical protein
MFTQYIPPTKWWRREIRISLPLWPKWLAQKLCKHDVPSQWNEAGLISVCPDCYKCVTNTSNCKHPMSELVVDVNNGDSPEEWHCTVCGKHFTKQANCPNCNLQMEITEYMGMFSGRFHCIQCGDYFFREDL